MPILDSESPSGDVCSLLEASGYMLMADPIKVGSQGKLHEAKCDLRAARLNELEETTELLRLELTSACEDLQLSQQITVASQKDAA